ncbi:MAG: NAD(P)/FAD-dependent oxidoreductase [Lachnospiraceae bacterium]|nr:NAD(P)/FAD-dependent oxidoreductase [Lachnospiraceae bacterium]
MEDVIIIGAGVTGAAVARELSKRELKVLVIEKNSDVCEGTSKANSGIAHGGYDALPGTLKARFNIRGSLLLKQLSKDLDFAYKQNGSLVLCPEGGDRSMLEVLYKRGEKNGVKGLEIIDKDRLKELEPNVNGRMTGALYVPTGAIMCPFSFNIALAENASVNGVRFRLSTEVKEIVKEADGNFRVITDKGDFLSKLVVNAAGVYADKFHNMVCPDKIRIDAVKGEYCLFDKAVGDLVSHTLFTLPTQKGKGVLVTPTVHGNLLVGPTAETVEDKEAVNTTMEGLAQVLDKGALSVESLPARKVITSFAGLRAHEAGGDFIVGENKDVKGFIDAAGIESPGLTAAIAIGEYVAEVINGILPSGKKADFIATRKGIPSLALADDEESQQLIKKDPAYANVICRCELVSEAEIVQAINRPLGATTLDGVKRRVRAGMGRCQAGFCSPKVVEILSRELGRDAMEITKAGEGSDILKGINKHEA